MIRDAIKISGIHLDRLYKAASELNKLSVEKALNMEDFEVIKVVDTFIFRFMKLQDYMGNRLFKAFLIEIGDYREDMSFIDVLDRLEKLRIIDSTENWVMLRKLRNKLAHEYPDEIEEILEDIKETLRWIDCLKDAYQNIKTYLQERNMF